MWPAWRLAFVSCEKYLKAEEDSPFVVEVAAVDAPAGSDVSVTVSLREGVKTGVCRSAFSVVSLSDGSSPKFGILSADGTTMEPSSEWTFGPAGTAGFRLTGIPAGKYSMKVTVTRWFHTATAATEFAVIL